jgi:hypothetical protein
LNGRANWSGKSRLSAAIIFCLSRTSAGVFQDIVSMPKIRRGSAQLLECTWTTAIKKEPDYFSFAD